MITITDPFDLPRAEDKCRNPAGAGIDPNWSEGLRGMAEHAKAQGFGGIVLMIDEFLLWLAEKSGQEFAREINDLNVVVDHDTGRRAAPIWERNPKRSGNFVFRRERLRETGPKFVW